MVHLHEAQMTSDHREKATLKEQYKEYRSSAQDIARQFREFSRKKWRHIHWLRILYFDGQISDLCDGVLDLVNTIEVARDTADSTATRSSLDTTHGSASRLLKSLESLHRLNTHTYIVFSGWFAIGIAAISVMIGILPFLKK